MIEAVRRLGARIAPVDADTLAVSGPPDDAGAAEIDAEDAGTVARFVMALAATRRGRTTVRGGPVLSGRPHDPLLAALRALGASVAGGPGLPVRIAGGEIAMRRLVVDGDLSSQFCSALLLAAPAFGGLEIVPGGRGVSMSYVAMTIEVMAAFGVRVVRDTAGVLTVPRGAAYAPASFRVPPDATGAMVFAAAATLSGGRCAFRDLARGPAEGELYALDVLERMGASVVRAPDRLDVAGRGTLRGVTADLRDAPDSAPALAVLAAFAEGDTVLTGIGHIQAKESDRIAGLIEGLRRLGVKAEARPDGLVVRGAGSGAAGEGGPVPISVQGDHRIAMAFALAGLRRAVVLDDGSVVAKSFPTFFEELARFGAEVR